MHLDVPRELVPSVESFSTSQARIGLLARVNSPVSRKLVLPVRRNSYNYKIKRGENIKSNLEGPNF